METFRGASNRERAFMARDRWPGESVRSWRGVLEERRPDREDFKYDTDADDHLLEAAETRRLHMLRGMFMAQTAEVEDLLATLCDGVLSIKEARKTPAGGLLRKLRKIAKGDQLSDQFRHVDWLLKRRNELVHATLAVGYVDGWAGERESVLTVLRPIRGGDVPWESAPFIDEQPQDRFAVALDPWACPSSSDFGASANDLEGRDNIDELDLERDLRRAHVALESAVMIFEHFSRSSPLAAARIR